MNTRATRSPTAGREGTGAGVAACGPEDVEAEDSGVGGGAGACTGSGLGLGRPVADAPTHAARAISASRAAAAGGRDAVPVKVLPSCTGLQASPATSVAAMSGSVDAGYGPLDGRTQTSP